ncbi:MAG TPA: tripartite tricarboxylate transporter substrate-binding protein [Stellaceae bacterium]|nr:tripartite tricarboxylate transporter substrate-binding protein [Stellaceae bacterium]
MLGKTKKYLFAAGMTVAMASASVAAKADSVADFYKGKTVTVLIGTSAGGGYDLYARVLAKYMGKHIPGNPTLVPQNMPGAGTLRVANYIYEVAPKDGTVFGTFSRSMPLSPLLKLPGVKFDSLKYTWLGSITKDTMTCISWKDSPVKKWDDIFTHEFKVGGEGKGADPDVYATMIKNAFHAKIKLVTGYPGTADITLAMQRGELDGVCGFSYSSVRSTHDDWIKTKQINFIIQGALEPDPNLPGVPMMIDEGKTPEQKAMLKLALAPQAIARPFVAPPGIPADRAQALQKAFDDTMKDPDFVADAKKLGLDVNPMTGAQALAMLKDIYKTPDSVVKETRAVMGY